MKTIGAKLDLVEEGKVIISVELKPSMMQQHGFGHAGVTFSIGDSAAGYAALTKMGISQEVLTSEMKIHLMSPAEGKMLKAVGSVLKAGTRLLIVQSNIYSGDDKNENNAIFEYEGLMVILYRDSGKNIRIFWNGFDAEWELGEVEATKKKMMKMVGGS